MSVYHEEVMGSEWHRSEKPCEPWDEDNDREDVTYDVHWMPDPWDGLCSPILRNVPKWLADYIAKIHNATLPLDEDL